MAVGLYGSAAFAPEDNVVALHLFERVFFLAVEADVVLLLPYCKFYVFGKRAEVEMTLVTG